MFKCFLVLFIAVLLIGSSYQQASPGGDPDAAGPGGSDGGGANAGFGFSAGAAKGAGGGSSGPNGFQR